MEAIVVHFATLGRRIILQIRAFSEAEMAPAPGDLVCQIQPVQPVRAQTTTNAANTTGRLQGKTIRELGNALLNNIPNTLPAQVSAASAKAKSAAKASDPATSQNTSVVGEKRKRSQESREQAEVDRPAKRVERENEVAQSETEDNAGGAEVGEPTAPADDTPRYSPRTLEAAETLLSISNEVQGPHSEEQGEPRHSPRTLEAAETLLCLRNQVLGPHSEEQGEDANAHVEPTDVPSGPEGEEASAEDKERLIKRRLQLMLNAALLAEGIGPIETDTTGERARQDVNYIADPADSTLYRTASGGERRVIRHQPPSLPSSPTRADKHPNESQPELDPGMHYWTSADGLKNDMKKFTPDPHQPPPPKRKWDDVIAAAEKAQEDAERGPKAPNGKATGKQSPGKDTKGKDKADESASDEPTGPHAKRAKRTPGVSRRHFTATPMRQTRAAAGRQRAAAAAATATAAAATATAAAAAAAAASGTDNSGEDEAPPKRLRLRLIVRTPPPNAGDGSN
ncbi:hypothetical protein AYO22_04690 [Fonsecaea multimorphosa]|nr:hypothetical protein AYO22_04690 [Fonsecaea multimorphosa]